MITTLVLATMVSATPSQKIAVVTKIIPRGAAIELRSVDLHLKSRRRIPKGVRPLIWNGGERLRAKRTLRVGTIIGQWDVDPMPDISAGDPVSIEMVRGNLRVTATAVAKEDGFAGETIWVQNEKSKRRIRVKVIESGRVELMGIRRSRR